MTSRAEPTWLRRWRTVRCWLHHIEDAALVAVLMSMLGLAVYQIILRNTLGYSLPWIDPLNRVGVLWIALLGSMIGTRRDNHIKIDLVSQMLPLWISRWVMRLVSLISSLALAVLAWHSWRLVADERLWSNATVAGIDTWQLQLIMPVAFAIMSLRYAIMVFRPVVTPSTLPIPDSSPASSTALKTEQAGDKAP